jgi:hypothetical protein
LFQSADEIANGVRLGNEADRQPHSERALKTEYKLGPP